MLDKTLPPRNFGIHQQRAINLHAVLITQRVIQWHPSAPNTRLDARVVQVGEAVEQVIATQRLTAQLRFDVRTIDAKIKIVDSRGGLRERGL